MIYRTNELNEIALVDDVYVVFTDAELNNPVIINETVNAILELCCTPRSFEDIVYHIKETFDCSEKDDDDIYVEISSCITDMLEASLLIECGEEENS